MLLGPADHSHGDGEYLRELIDKHNLSNRFMLWSDFLAVDSFAAYMQACDYVMPLIHPDHISEQLYSYQISGAFNLAFAYRKVLLVSSHLKYIADFEDTAIFYDLIDLKNLPLLLKKKGKTFYTDKKWTFRYQKETYLNALALKSN